MEVFAHQPVLLEESLVALAIRSDGVYVDATFGRGGHSRAILDRLNTSACLLALDQDLQAIAYGQEYFAEASQLRLEHCNFNQLKSRVGKYGLTGKVNGILMDLGVSSPQLDDASRGFSFVRSGPLDMRMDTSRGESAAQWLARVEVDDLVRVLRRYGEERFARRIASAIVAVRDKQAITTTEQLAQIVTDAIPVKEKHKHPATRSFQAIRIYVNQELDVLEQGLESAISVLAPGGRLVVISFHSLEDRIVKRFMRDKSSRPRLPPGLPVMDADIDVPYQLVGKSVVAGERELSGNPRARSARLRVLEKKA